MRVTNCPTEEQVCARAYRIYLDHGGQHGHDMDDWLQAEYELMQLPIHRIATLHTNSAKKTDTRKLALVSLVQAATILGATAFKA